ncbi:hypothetical protein [Flavobacterium foetidum]|uniref:hypothetical protein n=1 Tax=Flavobacterium foetidum TaxID=2026681 RepID=UPI001074A737|nr:hypothetical protein [Flavobacterium foetidum]
MRNLILSFCMILFFGFASAQETPRTNKSKTQTDSTYQKKGKHTKGTVKRGDTIKSKTPTQKQRKSGSPTTTPPRRDTINRTN